MDEARLCLCRIVAFETRAIITINTCTELFHLKGTFRECKHAHRDQQLQHILYERPLHAKITCQTLYQLLK
jgi:hypothetical protein